MTHRALLALLLFLPALASRAGQLPPLGAGESSRHRVQPAPAPRPFAAVAIGTGGADGFVTAADDGTLHVIYGGMYRSGPSPERLGPEEMFTDIQPVNGIRIDLDAAGQPHVVFTAGMTSKATRSYYTARVAGRWLPAEKFADAADFPERQRAFVADVAVDREGNALACFWVSRPDARRRELDNPSFHYRWRTAAGVWSKPRSLAAHWSSAPKVEFAPGRGFYLLWQVQGREWRIAGPVPAGGAFTAEASVTTGSAGLVTLSTQNEGCDFTVGGDGTLLVAGNVRERFEGPVGIWAAIGQGEAPMTAEFLGSFAGTKRGNESGLHPVPAIDAATGAAFVAVMNPADRRAYFMVRPRGGDWQRPYAPLLPAGSAPQGTLRQGPSLADIPGPGVVALIRDGEQRWHLRRLDPPASKPVTRWDALGETQELGEGATPGVAVSPDGTIHVVYMNGGTILHRERKPDTGFSSPAQVPPPPDVDLQAAAFNSPHLVCDAAGTLHMVFTNGFTGSSRKTWYTNRRDGNWMTPVVVIDHSPTGRRTNYPRLATDGEKAVVGAFAGGGSTVVTLVDLATAPRVAARADTPLWVAHPLLRSGGEIVVVGRRGAAGHHLETYDSGFTRTGPPQLLSRGTPTKTFEATAADIDDAGVVHAAGATQTPDSVLWYTTSERARAGQDVILGPALGTQIKEYTYPTLVCDAAGRSYISYRRHPAGDGRITVFDARAGGFTTPVPLAPAIHQRLRWNAPLAPAPGGGVYAVWESERRIYFRSVGVGADRQASARP